MIDRGDDYHAALASPRRREVLDVLLASPAPLDAAAVAERLRMHVTTARFHLDQLTSAGLVRHRTGVERRRGRPRLLYAPAGTARDENAREQLIEVLAATLERGSESDPAAAGRRWAERFDHGDDPTVDLVEVLDRLGFDPDVDAATATIRLHACPFRSAAREHPQVVCAVHRGLIERLVDDDSRPRLIPFVEPELCVVALHD